jgi:hypothetical protein
MTVVVGMVGVATAVASVIEASVRAVACRWKKTQQDRIHVTDKED